jgi:hypothetical protein
MEKCFVCKEEGHNRRNCPYKCQNNCGVIHKIGDCPKENLLSIDVISRYDKLICSICKKDDHSARQCLMRNNKS